MVGFYNPAAGMFVDFETINKDVVHIETLRTFRESCIKNINLVVMKGKALVPELQKEAVRSWADYLQPSA